MVWLTLVILFLLELFHLQIRANSFQFQFRIYRHLNSYITWSFNRCSTWCWLWNPWPSHCSLEAYKKRSQSVPTLFWYEPSKTSISWKRSVRKQSHAIKPVNLTQSKALHMTSQLFTPPCQPPFVHSAWISGSNLKKMCNFFLTEYWQKVHSHTLAWFHLNIYLGRSLNTC